MREILFRGQTRKFGEKVRVGDGAPVPGNWVYGGVMQGKGDFSIIYAVDENGNFDGKYPVYSDTVGQYTGLKDKNGTRIFEGDIVKLHWGEDFCEDAVGNVVLHDYAWCLKETDGNTNPLCDFDTEIMEVIGNIYDIPGVLK